MVTRIVSRCDNCGYDNRFPMDSDDSDGCARSDIDAGRLDGEGITRMCLDVPGSDNIIDEIMELKRGGWILRDVSQICAICKECDSFGPRIWYSMEFRTEGRRRFRNNTITCDCGGIMERFDPVEEHLRKAVYTCVKCGTENVLDRRFKLKDYEW